jgi:hypothetical protein
MSPFWIMVGLIAFAAYLLARFWIVGCIQERAVETVLDRHTEALEANTFDEDRADSDWQLLRSRRQARVLDPRFWTFRQFYPELSQ